MNLLKKRGVECFYCKEIIDPKSKYVILGTYEDRKIIREDWFHFICFKAWHEEKVKQKATTIVKHARDQIAEVIPFIKDFGGNSKGLEQIESMLNRDLDSDNGKKKRRKDKV